MNKWEKQFLQEIKGKTYGEAMQHLSRVEKDILVGWDSITPKDGKYYYYDHERKHRSKEEYGSEVVGENLNRYLAATKLQEDLMQNRIQVENI